MTQTFVCQQVRLLVREAQSEKLGSKWKVLVQVLTLVLVIKRRVEEMTYHHLKRTKFYQLHEAAAGGERSTIPTPIGYSPLASSELPSWRWSGTTWRPPAAPSSPPRSPLCCFFPLLLAALSAFPSEGSKPSRRDTTPEGQERERLVRETDRETRQTPCSPLEPEGKQIRDFWSTLAWNPTSPFVKLLSRVTRSPSPLFPVITLMDIGEY